MTDQTHADWLRGLAAFLDYAILGRVDTAKLRTIADDIAALTAERDRLREALEEYARDYGRGGDTARAALANGKG